MIQDVVRKTARRVGRRMSRLIARTRDGQRTTYVIGGLWGPLECCCSRIDESLLRPWRVPYTALAGLWLSHRFDLLGSGWVQVKHGMRCRGLEGHRYDSGPPVQPDKKGRWLDGRINAENLAEARRIWQLVDEDYVPIDWQLDFKSGYRWSEKTWQGDIRFGHQPGVDVKVPWELARMQHLPQLAWAYVLAAAGEPGFRAAEVYAREFRNQVLDFIATNPPRFGVNWQCTMDVAIRAANWLVAYDLFRAWDARFDDAFDSVFARSIYEHGRHIHDHLERHGDERGNHYLANIAGLLFVATYLPASPTTEAWLAFAIEELVTEVEFQFHPDGTNFEASTSYHRLAAEMVVYATALVLRRCGSSTPFPAWYPERLLKMAEFVMDVTKPSGEVPQIGDNDSGRFFKFAPAYRVGKVADMRACYANLDDYHDLPDEADYYDEIHGDHRHLVSAVRGLFEGEVLSAESMADSLETTIVRSLRGERSLEARHKVFSATAAQQVSIGTVAVWAKWAQELAAWPDKRRRRWEIPAPGSDLREGLVLCAYPDFGLYVVRSRRLYLAIRCDARAGRQPDGHAHEDQLSVELTIDGQDRIRDPGTYLYTPLADRRNQYRSMDAHCVPVMSKASRARLDQGLFRLPGRAVAECLYFGPEGFLGMLRARCPVYRRITFGAERLVLEDYGGPEGPLTEDAPHEVVPVTPICPSPGYGQLYRHGFTGLEGGTT